MWNAADHGTDGLLVTVRDITFSVPSYRVKSRIARATTSASVGATRTKVKLSETRCSATRRCVASVYDLGLKSSTRYVAARPPIAKGLPVRSGEVTLKVDRSKLARNHAYAVVIKRVGTRKLASTARGAVR